MDFWSGPKFVNELWEIRGFQKPKHILVGHAPVVALLHESSENKTISENVVLGKGPKFP